MADLTEQQLLSTDPDVLGLQRQRKLADLLTGQAFNAPQGQMISGRYVKPSNLQQALPMISAAIGGATGVNLDEKQQAMAEALRGKGNEAVQKVMQAYKQDPQTGLEMASALSQYPQVKALLPQLSKVALPEATTLEREFSAAKAQGYKGNINDFKNQMSEYQRSQAADAKQRLGLEGARFGLEGQKFDLEKEKLALELGGAKLTESQGNATAFGMRMKESNNILNSLEKQGVKDTGIVRSTVGGIVGMTPFVGEKMQQGVQSSMNVLPGALGGPSPQQQETDAARKNFVTAVLRKESGAAISPSEFYTESQKYFPQPGDSNSVIKQKQHARETAIKAMEVQAGPGKRQIEQMGAGKVVNFNDLP